MPIRERNIEANRNDGKNPGIGTKGMKNLISNDSDGYAAHDGIIQFVCPDGPTASYTFTVALDGKIQILDVEVIKTGGAGGASDTVQILNGATPVSDAISINIANKATARAAQIDANTSNNIVAGAGTIVCTVTKASGNNVACIVNVNVARSA